MALLIFSHINSIDKNDYGDYLISARHTNTLYKISGQDGSIIWRLGGKKSDFILDSFDFSSQHDARFRKENETHTVVSFLDNASDGNLKTSDFSSALIVSIDKASQTANILKRWDRPDVKTSNLRGNVQLLENGNTFVGWSANGYMSEFTPDGRCILEAQFTSARFSTYRSYRFPFSGTPVPPPDVKSFAFGTSPGTMTTVIYVSWNGATGVAWWNFYGSQMQHSGYEELGSAARSGFETVYQAAGYYDWIIVEAINHRGRPIRNATSISTQTAPGYDGVHVGASAIGKVNTGGSWRPPTSSNVAEVWRQKFETWPYRTTLQYGVIAVFSLIALVVLASASRRMTRGIAPPLMKSERHES